MNCQFIHVDTKRSVGSFIISHYFVKDRFISNKFISFRTILKIKTEYRI